MNISKVAPIAACLLVATLAISGCQSVRQLYGDIRGTNPACTRIAEYTSQVHNKRSFVGLADNVFVGKVEASDGQHVEGRDLYSLFKVQVISNLKGRLLGQVTVSQIGGHFNGRECLQNDDEILRTGKTYLFTTVYSKNIDKHFIAASNYGDVEFTAEDVATLERGALPPFVLEFKDAIANQILAKGK